MKRYGKKAQIINGLLRFGKLWLWSCGALFLVAVLVVLLCALFAACAYVLIHSPPVISIPLILLGTVTITTCILYFTD